jgi:nicotinate-nucleotide pyrophosphorylase (carboxylating)
MGGGHNHRFGLDDGILIKDNHLALAGSIKEVVERARRRVGHLHKIEVEVRTLEQLSEALTARADVIMLDNMTPDMTQEAVRIARDIAPDVLLEASGSMNLETVRRYAETGVDLISVGALTHSAPAVDISFKISPA